MPSFDQKRQNYSVTFYLTFYTGNYNNVTFTWIYRLPWLDRKLS